MIGTTYVGALHRYQFFDPEKARAKFNSMKSDNLYVEVEMMEIIATFRRKEA